MKLTDNPNGLQQAFHQEGLLHRITNRIRQSLELQQILTATVAEVRSFLGTDRVMVYRFAADGSGEVIAESINEQRLPSLLGLHFPADDIPPEAREVFLKERCRSIVDVGSGKIGLSPLQSKETGKSLKTANISYRPVDECHIEYLKAMGVHSSLVVPILHRDAREELAEPRLWGLLVSHHCQGRTVLKRELKVVQLVADQVAIAIAQSTLLSKARTEQEREAAINRIGILLHTMPEIKLQEALQETIAVFEADGGRLYIETHDAVECERVPSCNCGESRYFIYSCGEQPQLANAPYSLIEHHPVWQKCISECKRGSVWAVTDLYKEPQLQQLAPAFQSTPIRGLLVIPLYYREYFVGVLSIFRHEFDTETLWAGRRDHNERQLRPRLSFEAWRELKKGQAKEWIAEEVALAQTLAQHFAMAIQQQEMFQQIKALNANLECQVQERTAQLQKSLELARALKHITDQIRSTLDFKTILQTIVREVRNLLKTDRVIIYQFVSDSEGEVIIEDTSGNWPSVLGVQAPLECFPDEYARLYLKGRVRAINNARTADLAPCHQEFLQNMQVQANLVVPIKMGDHLWGLLIAHECEAPRKWQNAEIEVLQQLADQAAVAIQQAELYEQSRISEAKATAHATQLQDTLNDLQQTQAQLIQTEKMSSLGQLVAGVAHEINNPVNFIYGNLSHASEYTKNLLELLRLYQLHYPDPDNEIYSKAEEIDLDFLADDLPKIMASMKVGADRIRSLVLSLRNFSRIDQAKMKAVDLHEGLESTLLILQHRLKANANFPAIQLVKDYGDLPLVECYAGQINQVFMNILSNGIDALLEQRSRGIEEACYSPALSLPAPCIRISTRVSADNSNAIIQIADNGPGMTEAVQNRIFDPFFTTKPVGKGTGLGLAISYQIVVSKHRGVMKCISQPGQGTEFWIQIPLKRLVSE